MKTIFLKYPFIPGLIKKETFLALLLIYYLFVFSVSNYNISTILIKLLSSFLILFFLKDIRAHFQPDKINTILKVFIPILLYLFISAVHSENLKFGLTKLLVMISCYIPLILTALVVSGSPLSIRRFAYFIIFISASGSILALLLAPFDHSTIYSFSAARWSHVVFARITGFAILINVYLLLKRKIRGEEKLLWASLAVMVTGLIYSGARGTIVLTICCIFILAVFSKTLFYNKLTVLGLITLLSVFSIYFFPTASRLPALAGSIIEMKTSDSSILSRIDGFRIAVERWADNPVAGLGLGGYNSYYGSDLPQKLLYPHNLLLEILAEHGLIGFGLFVILIFLLAKRIYLFNKELLVFLLYAIGLAMYSKDLASNPMLFGMMAVFLFKIEVIEHRSDGLRGLKNVKTEEGC